MGATSCQGYEFIHVCIPHIHDTWEELHKCFEWIEFNLGCWLWLGSAFYATVPSLSKPIMPTVVLCCAHRVWPSKIHSGTYDKILRPLMQTGEITYVEIWFRDLANTKQLTVQCHRHSCMGPKSLHCVVEFPGNALWSWNRGGIQRHMLTVSLTNFHTCNEQGLHYTEHLDHIFKFELKSLPEDSVFI